MRERESLGKLAALVGDRILVGKDEAKRYIGLEHMPSSRATLTGSSPALRSTSANGVFQAGDILFGKLRPQLRKSVRVNFDGYCSTDILVIRPKSPQVGGFVSLVMASEDVFRAAIRTEEGTKMPRCCWRSLEKIEVFCPQNEEQRRIAEILSTLDEAIEQTETLIAKYQQIKAGLMHDLFTRGLTPDGHLRPTRNEAPHLYKQSPIGWIPNEWSLMAWRDLITSWAMGPRFSAAEYSETGNVAVLRTTDIDSEGRISYATMPKAYLRLDGLRQHLLQENDIVISRSGSCGIAAVFASFGLPVLPGAFLIRFRFSGALSPPFLTSLVNSTVGAAALARITEGGVQKNIRGTELCRLLLALPSRNEQNLVTYRINEIEHTRKTAEMAREKLSLLKSGLMQDLLTGRVRVPIPELTPA